MRPLSKTNNVYSYQGKKERLTINTIPTYLDPTKVKNR